MLCIQTGTEFVECIITQGHFCNIENVLYHVTNSNWYLTALFLKNGRAIEENCKLAMSRITKSQTMYLDQVHWTASVAIIGQIEISFNTNRHFMTINPPPTSVEL